MTNQTIDDLIKKLEEAKLQPHVVDGKRVANLEIWVNRYNVGLDKAIPIARQHFNMGECKRVDSSPADCKSASFESAGASPAIPTNPCRR